VDAQRRPGARTSGTLTAQEDGLAPVAGRAPPASAPVVGANGVLRIISGGQTGVDRAALDVALDLGLECGGWCPRGRRAEDGAVPPRYPLEETPERSYRVRTERNVLGSDATLILVRAPLSGGTALTAGLARRHRRPLLLVDLDRGPAPHRVREWLRCEAIRLLNVAGPRESERPGIGSKAREYLLAVLAGEETG
jgi:hypothetical protein